jgi:hypothetical protein
MKTMIKIREVEDKDLIPLSEFLPKGFPYTTKKFWIKVFDRWWINNPAYTPDIPRGWVIEQDTALLGFIGNIPVKFLVNGSVKIAAASNSWYVDPAVRGIPSIRLFNEFLKQKNVSLFLFKKGADESIINILSKYKFDEYILPESQKEYFYIMDKKMDKRKVNLILSNYIKRDKRTKLPEFFYFYKRLVVLFFAYMYQKPIIRGDVSPDEVYTTSLCDSCDDSFSIIKRSYLNPCDIALSPDTKTLNWLYFSSPRCNKRIVIQCRRSRDNTLAGYMVFDLKRMKASDEATMALIDMCIENNDPHIMASLLSFAIKIGKQNNAALLIVWANSQETETYFKKTIFLRRTAKYFRYMKFSDHHKMNVGRDKQCKVCLPVIYPPQ